MIATARECPATRISSRNSSRDDTRLIIGCWPGRWSTWSLLLSDTTSGASGCCCGETGCSRRRGCLTSILGQFPVRRVQAEPERTALSVNVWIIPRMKIAVSCQLSTAKHRMPIGLYRVVIPSGGQSIPDEQDIGSSDSQPVDDFLQAVRFVDSFAGHVEGRRASAANFKSGQSLGGVRAEFFFLVPAWIPRGFPLHRRRLAQGREGDLTAPVLEDRPPGLALPQAQAFAPAVKTCTICSLSPRARSSE